jgi:AcrR family transcriptional regulator
VVSTETGRRSSILDEATRLFYEHGYANVGMRAIADAIGIRPASLYHHFPGKEEMLYDIALAVTERFVDNHVSVLDAARYEDSLRDLVVRHVIFGWEHRAAIEVTRREMRELAPAHYDAVTAHEARYRQSLQTHLSQGARAGRFVDVDVRLMSLSIIEMLNGVNEWFDVEGERTIEDVADWYADVVVDQLLAPRGR